MGKKLVLVLVTVIVTVVAFIPSTKSSCSKSGSTVCASETDATDISDISDKTEEFDFKDVPEYKVLLESELRIERNKENIMNGYSNIKNRK